MTPDAYLIDDPERIIDEPIVHPSELIGALRELGYASPAAADMSVDDVVWQVVEANPGVEIVPLELA